MHRVKRLAVLFCALLPLPAQPPVPVLTSAREIRALSAGQAAEQRPVRLRATVNAIDPGRSIFIQDATGGTFINRKPEQWAVQPGDVIEAEGVTYPGLFLPGIAATSVRVTGRAEMPATEQVTFDDLLGGKWHYQRVSIGGIVRSATVKEDGRTVLNLAVGARRLEVHFVLPGDAALPRLTDARVRVAGLATGYVNDKRQIIAPQIYVSRVEDLHIEEPPPEDSYAAPITSTTDLLHFRPEGISGHCVRLRGTVTHSQPGEAIFLRDEGRGLLVQVAASDAPGSAEPLQPGDVVEVAGFPAMGRFSAFVEDAIFRKAGTEALPEPVRVTMKEALKGAADADLVTLEAQLIEVLETASESVLLLRAGDTAFRARISRTQLSLRNGTRVSVTGICQVDEPNFPRVGFQAKPRSIEVLLRSPADITVLAAPSGWTARRLAWAGAGLLGIALATLIWAVMLRRRVAVQTAVIREKVEREAMLEERQRVAREMHDTLAQSFSGLGFQLEALAAGLPADAHANRTKLETAKQMVRHGQEEFRRSLMNLRAGELERGGLAAALPELARQITAGTGIALHFEVKGTPRGLPDSAEANLLRICQECVNNAVRHARPKSIAIGLAFEPSAVRLHVTDDGTGFDPEQATHSNTGHFGLRGIRERAAQIRANVELHSRPGEGTKVTVNAPL